MRVFYDRLVDDKDRTWLFETVRHLIKEHFKDSIDNVFEHLANGGQPGGALVEEDMRSLMFGDYMNPDAEAEEKRYEEVKSLEEFYAVAEQCLDEYNNTHKTRMNLVVFRSILSSQCHDNALFIYRALCIVRIRLGFALIYRIRITCIFCLLCVQVRAGAPVAHQPCVALTRR